jgi:hypothetical protein
MNQDNLIDAANAQAELYDGDDRQDIKTDVMNAFFAGAKFGALAEREACTKVCEETGAQPSSLWEETGCWTQAAETCAFSIRMRSNA